MINSFIEFIIYLYNLSLISFDITLFTIFSNILSNILSIIGLLIAYLALKKTKKSLVFDQRSILMKESFEPIYNDIVRNKDIGIESNVKLNFQRLEKIRETYFFPAFDNKAQTLINSIINLSKDINNFKKQNEGVAKAVALKVLNKELLKNNSQKGILRVYRDYNYSVQTKGLYELVISKELSTLLLSHNSVYRIELESSEDYSLHDFIREYLNIKLNIHEYVNSSNTDINKLQMKIYNQLIQTEHYQKIKKTYEKLLNQTNELNDIIVSRVKKLIGP